MTVLAVGAAGNIAGLVVPELVEHGATVRGLVRKPEQVADSVSRTLGPDKPDAGGDGEGHGRQLKGRDRLAIGSESGQGRPHDDGCEPDQGPSQLPALCRRNAVFIHTGVLHGQRIPVGGRRILERN